MPLIVVRAFSTGRLKVIAIKREVLGVREERMEFGCGFVAGGLLTGFVTAKRTSIANTVHGVLGKIESSLKAKVAARRALLKSKL